MPALELITLNYLPTALAAAALVLALIALRRKTTKPSPVPSLSQLVARLEQQAQTLERLSANFDSLSRHLLSLEERQLSHLQRLSLVRFRAFPEVGSDLSFSLALLDGRGNGVILTSLFGRDETRVYAKPVKEGRSPYRLAPEEEQALVEALSSSAARMSENNAEHQRPS